MIRITLDEVVNKLGLTNKYLSERSNVRPNTITELNRNNVKRVDIETLDRLIHALNDIASERGLGISFTVSDILSYDHAKDQHIMGGNSIND